MKGKLKLLLVVVLSLSLIVSGCSSSDDQGGADQSTTDQGTEQGTDSTEGGDSAVADLEGPIAEQSILLTSVGQSADVEMVKVMLDRVEYDFVSNNLADAEDLGTHKTLLLAIGGSSKGLGAAGIDENQELERVNALIAAAKDNGMIVIAAHIGGEARRGELSDKFITPIIPQSDYVIVVDGGDKDGLIAGLAADNGIPMGTVATMTDVTSKLELSIAK